MNRYDRFDKPFRILPTFDERKGLELFNIASKLDTHELLQYSLVNQIPLDYINNDGECLIHEVINIDGRKASEHAKLNVIKFLVQNKVNPDKSNKNNQTPLHLACIQQLPVIVEYLLSIGVNPNFQDNMGNTPLHYLLTGLIKTVDSSNEVMDFVPAPKKQNLDSNKKTIEIKKLLWDYINSNVSELPLLETIEKTIDNVLNFDKDIVDRQRETNKLIVKLAKSSSSEDKSAEIKDLIQITKKTINDKLIKLFDGLPDLPNFEIHNKNKLSWSPVRNPSLALISNGNVKTVIKKDLEKIKKELIDMSDNFNLINIFNPNYNEDGYEELSFSKIVDQFIKSGNISQMRGRPANQYIHLNPVDPTTGNRQLLSDDYFKSTNDSIRHYLALDNASDIIDWNKLKYTGGPRIINVQIKRVNPWDDFKFILTSLSTGWNDGQIILSMLGNIDVDAEINKINDDSFNLVDYINVFDNAGFNDGTNIINFYPLIFTGGINQLKIDYCFYLILAHTAIFAPDRFDDISNIVGTATLPLDFTTNIFAKKWFDIYKNTPNINLSSWIYSMYCDQMCKVSVSNLDCIVLLDLLMLLSALQNNKNDKMKSIINSYKPHLISNILAKETANESVKLAKIIITMGNYNMNLAFLNQIETPMGTKAGIDGLPISDDLKNLGKLLYDWYDYLLDYSNGGATKKFDPNNTAPEYKLYDKFSNLDDDPEDVFVKIILAFNEDQDNQLLKQTIIDLICRIKSIRTKDQATLTTSIGNFKELSGLELYGVIPPGGFPNFNFDLTNNLIPSLYGQVNYNIDGQSDLGSCHIKIAHLLGLHYQGMVYKTDFDLNNHLNVNIQGFGPAEFFFAPNNYHLLATDSLGPYQLPLLLNYLMLTNGAGNGNTLTPNSKYYYYCITGREFRIPTHIAYANMLLDRIYHHQLEILRRIKRSNGDPECVEIIIENMTRGKTDNLAKLYVEKYPEIVTHSNMLSDLIESFNELKTHYSKDAEFNGLNPMTLNKTIGTYDYVKLARGLNKINSNYYLYYYIYQPGKIIGLSRFNYYQIPIDSSTKSLYYLGASLGPGLGSAPSNLVDIINGEPIGAMPGATPESNSHVDPADLSLKLLNRGFIGDFKIGNYASMLDEYNGFKLPVNRRMVAKDFARFKGSSLPPSLYYVLNEFYKNCLIELVKNILEKIEAGKTAAGPVKEIYDKSEQLIKSSSIAIQEYDLVTYDFITKLIQELIKEQVTVLINNSVVKKYNQFMTKIGKAALATSILATKEMKVSLTNIDLNSSITKKTHFKNLYSLVIQPPKSTIEPFILYPNDLTNINRLRSKYGVTINPSILTIMMKSNASPYVPNADGYTTIFPVIKNYNYKLIQMLKSDNMIDFRSFKQSPIDFILQENINNLNKILSGIDTRKSLLKDLFKNIDGYLFNDVKTMITANELFGNNVLLYLSESFDISSYLTLQYLSESLKLDSNVDFNIIDLENILGLINDPSIILGNLDKNYLGENLNSLRVPDKIESIIINKLLMEKVRERDELTKKIKELDEKDEELKKKDLVLHTKINIKGSTLYLNLTDRKKELVTDIKKLKNINLGVKNLSNITPRPDPNFIVSYDQYNKSISSFDKIGLMIKAWSKLLEENSIKSNYNLVPIFILDKQQKIMEKGKISPNDLEDLVKIEKVMAHWSLIAESYFSNKKYTSQNDTLVFINSLLKYITKMIIGNGIELMMRRILMTWLQNATITNTTDYEKINEYIQWILEEDLVGKTDVLGNPTNMLKELYEVVCPKLVKNSAEIFEDKSDEQAHLVQQTKEILMGYFQLLDLTPMGGKIPDDVKNIFRVQVVNYFDTFTSKSILSWYVNIENILKYFINNYRCLKTFIELNK
jgi:hypothetical protein